MPLTSIYGEMGTGKTLFMTVMAAHSSSINPSVPIFANYKLKLHNYKKLEPDLLLEMAHDKALVLIDEAYTWLESFTSGSRLTRYLNYILFQSRKRGLDMYITAQLPRTVTLRFRELTSRNVYCMKTPKGFKYIIEKQQLDGFSYNMFLLPFTRAEKYYRLYDTNEIVMTREMKDLSIEFVLQNPDRLKQLIDEVVSKLASLEHVTKSSVEAALIENGYPAKLSKFVYPRLKEAKKSDAKS